MVVKTILKFDLQQKQANIFFQCLQDLHLEAQKTSMMYTEVKTA